VLDKAQTMATHEILHTFSSLGERYLET
jgi:hypothetical protein